MNTENTPTAIDLTLAFEGREVLITGTPDSPLFSLKHVCENLGLKNSRQASHGLDAEDLTSAIVTSGGQRREMTFLTECGLYHLIFNSRKEQGKRFRRWVLKIVSEIRRTGAYRATLADARANDVIAPSYAGADAVTVLVSRHCEFVTTHHRSMGGAMDAARRAIEDGYQYATVYKPVAEAKPGGVEWTMENPADLPGLRPGNPASTIAGIIAARKAQLMD
ncbi:MAG: Bro-N domain-containing protein [Verrucomicrobiota bacterium]